MARIGRYLRQHHLALIALFVALGGTSYAAVNLPKNSVGSKQIKPNAVNSSKVKNRSLLAADFKPGQLPAGAQGAQGPAGPQGSTGPKGDKGDIGDRGLTGPTQGFAKAITSAIPSATADAQTPITTDVATSAGGRIFAIARGSAFVACSAGTNVELGLYVDGTAVPASGQQIMASTSTPVDMWGVSGNVSAGAHTVSVGADCTSGTTGTIIIGGDSEIAGILLGS